MGRDRPQVLQPDDPDEGQRLGGRAARRRGVHDEPLVDVGQHERVAVELDATELGVVDRLAGAAPLGDRTLPPEAGEQRAAGLQLGDEAGQPGIVGIAGGHVAQRGDGLDRRGLLLAGIGRHPPAAPEEPLPGHVPLPGGPRREVAEQRGRQVVPGEHVALGVEQDGRQVADAVEQAQRAGPGRRHDVARRGRRRAADVEQVVALVVGQPERPRQRRRAPDPRAPARGPARGARGSRPRCPPAAPPPRAAGRGRGGGCRRAARRRRARAGPGTS